MTMTTRSKHSTDTTNVTTQTNTADDTSIDASFHQPVSAISLPSSSTTVTQRNDKSINKKATEKKKNSSKPKQKKQSAKHHRCYYNESTSYHLKKLFFETVGKHGRQPTRLERRQLVEQTGVNPRKITYFMSNMKRRHIKDLEQYNQLLKDGFIDGSYDSFLNYCRNHPNPNKTDSFEPEQNIVDDGQRIDDQQQVGDGLSLDHEDLISYSIDMFI